MFSRPSRSLWIALAVASLAAGPAAAQESLFALQSPNPEYAGQFGSAVSEVPDADGDGKSDLLVGAFFEDVGATNAGRAYLYSGATGALLLTLESPDPRSSGQFGSAVAGVSDTDGDGRGDLLIGVRQEDGGAVYAGRAYLFSGATGTLLQTLESPNPEVNGNFGGSVSGVSDADDDGRGDLVIGAVGEDGGASNAGRTYLFSGATGALLLMLESPNNQSGGSFGTLVSGVPDTDGDERDDILVGAPFESGGATGAGRAYLFSGSTGTLLQTLESPNTEAQGNFGRSVAGVIDADSDGWGDLLVGAPFESGGRAYLFSGATSALLQTLEGVGWFGWAVSGVPDANADGKSDLLVGAPFESNGAANAGRAYLFSGGTGALIQTLGLSAPEFDDRFGLSVVGISDVDSDGRGDLFVGASGDDGGDTYAGRAYLFSGAFADLEAMPTGPLTLAPGETFFFDYSIANITTVPLTGAIRAEVRDANGTVLTDFSPVVRGTLEAGTTFASMASQQVPLAASPGTYEYVLLAENTEGGSLDQVTFEITVTGRVQPTAELDPMRWPTPVFTGRFEDAVVTEVPAVSDAETVSRAKGEREAEEVAAYPNPFADRTTLAFEVAESGPVRIAVYDALGREVAVLVDEDLTSGRHEIMWTGTDASGQPVAAGGYVVRITTGTSATAQRVTLVR